MSSASLPGPPRSTPPVPIEASPVIASSLAGVRVARGSEARGDDSQAEASSSNCTPIDAREAERQACSSTVRACSAHARGYPARARRTARAPRSVNAPAANTFAPRGVDAHSGPARGDRAGRRWSANGDRFGSFGIEIDTRTADSPRGLRVLARIPDVFGPGRSAEMTYFTTAVSPGAALRWRKAASTDWSAGGLGAWGCVCRLRRPCWQSTGRTAINTRDPCAASHGQITALTIR